MARFFFYTALRKPIYSIGPLIIHTDVGKFG